MNDKSDTGTESRLQSPPNWFWWVAATGLVWNIIGVAAFAGQMMTDLDSLPEAQRAFHLSTPLWATLGFAAAVAGGALGCVGLLLRKSLAILFLVLSVLGLIVQISHSMFVSNGIEVFGPASAILPAFTFLIAIALLGFARSAKRRGWLA